MHNKVRNQGSAKDFAGSLKKLLKYNKTYIPYIVIALVLAILSTILSILGPDKIKEITNVIIDGILIGVDLKSVRKIGIVLIIFYALSFVFNYLEALIMAQITNIFSKKMRSDISNKINKLPLSYFDKTTVGDVLSRVTNDVDMIGNTMNDSFATLVVAVTMFFGSLFMMIKTSPILALTAVLSSLFGFVLVSLILKKSQKYFNEVQRELGEINGFVEEMYTGHNVIKAYNAEEETTQKFESINERLYRNGLKSQFYSRLMFPIMGFIGNFGYVMVCIVGAILVTKGNITFGVIVAFMIYIRLFTQPLNQFAQAMAQLQATAASSERVFEFLEAEELKDESNLVKKLDKNEVKGEIEFKNVKFGYDEDKSIIKNFSARVLPGQKVAIVGPTGAGKTTLVNLLMKFYELNSGEILIDGVSTKELTRENVHDLFVMVLQDTWLFEGTIKDNIRYNDPAVSDEEIKRVCKLVGLDHFIKTLPKGYDTVLDDSDVLSLGQKQLLTIARSMIDDSPFLILDEATSSVDTRTEVLVQKAMDELTKGRTSFIIAHRLSTIREADLILVLKDGNIVEQGTHEELIEKNGFYAELYNSQFQNIDE